MLAFEPKLGALLEELHTRSRSQDGLLADYYRKRAKRGVDLSVFDADTERFMSDKLVALDVDKAEFCYHVCRALGAKRIVEAGTSFGVSTLYLAAAVRDNGHAPGDGLVIGTEHEPDKALAARSHFERAGLAPYIDLREGDLRETLAHIDAPIDFMLMDIWTPMVLPAIERVAPCLRRGAVVIADNTTTFRDAYDEYFHFIANPANGLRTQTLPFDGGLEFTVKEG